MNTTRKAIALAVIAVSFLLVDVTPALAQQTECLSQSDISAAEACIVQATTLLSQGVSTNPALFTEFLVQCGAIWEKIVQPGIQECTTSTTSCTLGDQTIQDGQSITAYQSASVASGSQCVSETRSCTSGTLSGSYTNTSCTVGQSATSLFSVGERVQTTAALNVRTSASTGASLVGTEASGALGTIAGGPTTTSDGYTWWQVNYDNVLSGWSVQDYLEAATQSSTTSTSCTFNGQTIPSGASVTAYQASSVPSGSLCVSQTQTCTDGTLSGTYTNASCTVSSSSTPITTLTLSTTPGPAISPLLYGVDYQWNIVPVAGSSADPLQYPTWAKWDSAMNSIAHITLAQFPGGWNPEHYDWTGNTSPDWTNSGNANQHYENSIDEPGVGPTSFVAAVPAAEFTTPSAEYLLNPTAANLASVVATSVTLVDKYGSQVKLWEIGNEWWLQNGATLAQYANLVAAVAPAMQAEAVADGDSITIYASGNWQSPSDFTTLKNDVIADGGQAAWSAVGGISVHAYCDADNESGPEPDCNTIASALTTIRANTGKDTIADFQWNGPQQTPIDLGIQYASDMPQAFQDLALARVSAGIIWPVIGNSEPGRNFASADYSQAYAPGTMFGWLSQYYEGVALSVSGGNATAAQAQNGNISVFVSSGNTSGPQEYHLSLAGTGITSVVSAQVLYSSDPTVTTDTANTGFDSQIATLPVTIVSSGSSSYADFTLNPGTSGRGSDYEIARITFSGSPAPAVTSCTFNGETIASGTSVTAYQASSVPSGSSCVSQSRTCTSGTLSGTYTNASCVVSAPSAPVSTITLSSTPGLAINPSIYGINYDWNLIPAASAPAWISSMHSLGVTLVRYPSGWNAEHYNWTTNQEVAFITGTGNCYDPNPSSTTCKNTTPGATPGTISAAFPSDFILPSALYVQNPTAANLASLLATAQSVVSTYGSSVPVWEIGNEWWLQGSTAASAEATRLANYATLVKTLAPAMKAINPNIKIYVQADWSPSTEETQPSETLQSEITTLRNDVGAAAWADVDGISIHAYCSTQGTESCSDLPGIVSSIEQYSGKTSVFDSEWAAGAGTDNTYNAGLRDANALLVAIGDDIAGGGVSLASYWPGVDFTPTRSLTGTPAGGYKLTSSGTLFSWMSQYFEGHILSTTGNVTSVAAQNSNGDITVFVAPDVGQADVASPSLSPQEIQISLAGTNMSSVVSAQVLYSTQALATSTAPNVATLPVTIVSGSQGLYADFTLDPGTTGRGSGFEIARITFAGSTIAQTASIDSQLAAAFTALQGILSELSSLFH